MLTQQKDHWKEEHTHDAFILVVVRVVYMHMQVSYTAGGGGLWSGGGGC